MPDSSLNFSNIFPSNQPNKHHRTINNLKKQKKKKGKKKTYLLSGIVDEEDSIIEGFRLTLLLDLNLGVIDGGTSERLLERRYSPGEASAGVKRTLLGQEMNRLGKQAGSGGGGVCDGHDSCRRHGWTVRVCLECVKRVPASQ